MNLSLLCALLNLSAMSLAARKKFNHAQPEEKLGTQHPSLQAFEAAVNFEAPNEKRYTLCLITEPARQRILLGKKHRGFGRGMFNSFGGKLEEGETEAEGARRELLEETGIDVDLHVMSNAKVGVLHFTFADSPTKMTVHLFRVNVDTTVGKENPGTSSKTFKLDPSVIRGCDEITPVWFDDWYQIPFQNMFSDDSVWLTHLLDTKEALLLDGYFHFDAGGQETNQILHYFVDGRSKTFTMEQRLFHELHNNLVRSPTIKEFKESYAFVNAVRKMFPRQTFDLVLDVAGGHGALACLFLTLNVANEAVVIDPANVGGGGVRLAWKKYIMGKTFRYRHEGLQTGLPAEIMQAIKCGVPSDKILVVACHACQHLSDETLEICCRNGVHAAVLPCCQRDLSPGGAWKAVAKRLGIHMEVVMDILLAGKAMSWPIEKDASVAYDVRIKVLEGSSTPQNRLILCRADASLAARRQIAVAEAQDHLDRAYRRAHAPVPRNKKGKQSVLATSMPLIGSFLLGIAVATTIASRRGM